MKLSILVRGRDDNVEGFRSSDTYFETVTLELRYRWICC